MVEQIFYFLGPNWQGSIEGSIYGLDALVRQFMFYFGLRLDSMTEQSEGSEFL